MRLRGETLAARGRERRRWLRFGLAAGVCALLSLAAAPAAADLGGDVAAMAAAWQPRARLETLRPRLLTRGEEIFVPLPPWAAGSPPASSRCTSVLFMASTSVGFTVEVAGRAAEPEPSQVGWAQLSRCGRRRAELTRIGLEMRSPRGVVEMLVADSAAPLASPARVLPHRDPGPASAPGETGPPPFSAPLEVRVEAWETLARAEGADRVRRLAVRAGAGQIPMLELQLGEGCHRLSALALQVAPGASPPDLDLLLRGAPAQDLVRGEQSENSDAEIEVCVGAPAPVEVAVPGLPPGDPAVLQHAEFPLPAGLPQRWGAEARARFARAFFVRGQGGPARPPVVEVLGVAGRTPLPLELEPRTCYAAAVAVVEGRARSLVLGAMIRDREAARDVTSDEPALALAFCMGDDPMLQLRVETSGSSLIWLAAVWRSGAGDLRQRER